MITVIIKMTDDGLDLYQRVEVTGNGECLKDVTTLFVQALHGIGFVFDGQTDDVIAAVLGGLKSGS